MPRRLCLILFAATLQAAGLLPDRFGQFQKQSSASISLTDSAVWREFGLDASEEASYKDNDRLVAVRAYRLADPTAAFAAFEWQRPADAVSALTAAKTRDGKLLIHANYLLEVTGQIHPSELEALYGTLPKKVTSSLPPLSAYLPALNRQPNSERYVLGAASLALFEPRLDPKIVDFSVGAELQLARYRDRGSDVHLAVISYPTPQIAAKRLPSYQAIPESAVRRIGPIVAVAFGKPEPAQKAVAAISYEPKFTWAEKVSSDTPQDAAKMILAISLLAVVLIVASVLFGLAFGGLRIVKGRFGMRDADESLTKLNLESQ